MCVCVFVFVCVCVRACACLLPPKNEKSTQSHSLNLPSKGTKIKTSTIHCSSTVHQLNVGKVVCSMGSVCVYFFYVFFLFFYFLGGAFPISLWKSVHPLVEFMYLVFTHKPGESSRRRCRSLSLFFRDVFQALINSPVCWFFYLTPFVCWYCTGALGLVPFQIVIITQVC